MHMANIVILQLLFEFNDLDAAGGDGGGNSKGTFGSLGDCFVAGFVGKTGLAMRRKAIFRRIHGEGDRLRFISDVDYE